MQQSLAEDIRDRLDTFTVTERRAALALLGNYPMLGLGTVAEFARVAGVSSPSILRFAARLGYSTYAEFQRRLRDELEDQLKSPLARAQDPGASPEASGEVWSATIDNIRETFQHLPAAEIKAAIELIADERRSVYLLGGRFSDALARHMAAHLRILRGKVVHLAGQEGNWRDFLIDMRKRDVLVIFDIRRYQGDVIRLAQAAAARGVQIVLITDTWLSPVASVAAHVLPARVSVPSPWDSLTALMTIAETLIAGVTRAESERSQTRMSELERLRDEEDPQRKGAP
ncbi:MurR/RpiR family transcriptional regulator [Rhizobiales bacterium]|uniref:MurR/RpiR family transcriptional regulator n=1 Tax=Hongsoonwoonella zoysiae TaxID=2821844 RepID=UPI001561198B|nr:MurR/RpiR family transcriptional regulator [Hongsoonwoonella zoysiae]NRG16714.1 MurR/RpiR family transcriptional regulator [Hongsoonwoonella zoysiae]